MHIWGYHVFPPKISGLTVPKNFVGILSMFQKNWGIEKFFFVIAGITFFRRKICVSQCRKKLWASLEGFRKFWAAENFIHNRGFQVFPSKSFCLTVSKFFIGEHCGVSEKLFYRKFSFKGGGEGVTISSIFFCLTGLKRKSLYRKDSVFQEIPGIAKKLWIGGDISRFPVEIFMSHRAEKFRDGIPLLLRKFQVSKSFLDEKGGITFFRQNLQVSQCRKFSLASLEGFRRFGCRKILCITGGIIFFRRKFWASQCWNFLWASLQNFRNFGVLKIFIHNRGYDVFPSQSFCLTVPNYFIGEHCGVSEKFFYRNFPCIGGGGHHDYVDIFCPTGPKRNFL